MSLMVPGSPTRYGPAKPKMIMEPARTSPAISLGVRDGNNCRPPRRLDPATAMAGSRVVIEVTIKPFCLCPSPSARIDDRVQKVDDQVRTDRKSTGLNSSHANI